VSDMLCGINNIIKSFKKKKELFVKVDGEFVRVAEILDYVIDTEVSRQEVTSFGDITRRYAEVRHYGIKLLLNGCQADVERFNKRLYDDETFNIKIGRTNSILTGYISDVKRVFEDEGKSCFQVTIEAKGD